MRCRRRCNNDCMAVLHLQSPWRSAGRRGLGWLSLDRRGPPSNRAALVPVSCVLPLLRARSPRRAACVLDGAAFCYVVPALAAALPHPVASKIFLAQIMRAVQLQMRQVMPGLQPVSWQCWAGSGFGCRATVRRIV